MRTLSCSANNSIYRFREIKIYNYNVPTRTNFKYSFALKITNEKHEKTLIFYINRIFYDRGIENINLT